VTRVTKAIRVNQVHQGIRVL
jgi:hypothetical protein